ncbi:MAG: copper resistance CopC family protein, partial [Kineosporiaceae bacterium]
MSSGPMGRLIIVVACALASLAGPAATPAQAHSGVRSIEPADGSTLTTAPQAVRLTFTENVLAGTAQLRVTGPGGQVATEPVTQGPRVVGPLPRELPNGAYTVLWRVTSADGHPISGSFGFVLAVAGATSPSPSPSPASTSSSAASAAASSAASPVNPLDPASAADGLGSGAKTLLALGAV